MTPWNGRLSTLELEREARASDGTVKALLRTARGNPVEAVLMRYRDGRRSLCLSSQSGCPLTCSFCATGRMRFAGNLSADEILDQALHFRRNGELDHAVFMGMGEPMMNLDAVLEACTLLPGLGITNRRTAISTVGWIPGIERLGHEHISPGEEQLALGIGGVGIGGHEELAIIGVDRVDADARLAGLVGYG